MAGPVAGVFLSLGAILLTQVLVYLVAAGCGLLLRRAVGLRDPSGDDWFIAFWMGLALIALYLLAWHVGFAVTGIAWVPILVVGSTGIWLHRHDLTSRISTAWRQQPWMVATVAFLGVWVADLAMGSVTLADDSVGYHLQSIRWASAAPLVPGLANLHGPLGFTSASTLYHALLRATPWGDLAHHVAGSTLVVVLLAQGVSALFDLAAERDATPPVAFNAMLVPAVATLTNPLITSLATDLPTMLVMLAAFSVWYRLCWRDDRTSRAAGYDVVTVATLLTLAVAFKFGTAVVAVLSWLLVVGTWLSQRPGARGRWRPVAWATALSTLLAGAWMSRSLILSGYPVFPNTFGAIDVPWRVPLEHAQAELGYIVHSGRATAGLLGTVPGIDQFQVWFPRWLPRLVFEDPFSTVVPMIVALLASIRYVAIVRGAPASAARRRAWRVLLPFVPGVLAWLAAAPEPRYLRYLVWTTAATCVAQLVAATGSSPAVRRRVAGGIAALALTIVVVDPVVRNPDLGVIEAIVTENLNREPVGAGTRTLGVPDGSRYVTRSGIELFVPAPDVRHCFNAPMPCTPNPAPNLRLLDPESPVGGFAVDGDWQMIGWPVAWLPHLREALAAGR